jgi:hypothetical protein
MDMSLKARRAHVAVAILTAAWVANGAYLTKARALPPQILPIDFVVAHDRPVSGRTFTGIGITVKEPGSTVVDRVLCDALIGKRVLRAHRRVFYSGKRVAEIMCSWDIPAHSAGLRLRLRDTGEGARATVYLDRGQTVISSPVVSWIVRRSRG